MACKKRKNDYFNETNNRPLKRIKTSSNKDEKLYTHKEVLIIVKEECDKRLYEQNISFQKYIQDFISDNYKKGPNICEYIN